MGDAEERSRWERALALMQLARPQQEQLLLLRSAHLAKLREVYRERERLNMAAMAQMLPSSGRFPPGGDASLEGRLAAVSTTGYLPMARSNAELAAVLDAVKDNLRREQRAVMDLNCITISRILSPVQAARYMMAAYPQHCDALALSNVLARSLGDADPAVQAAAALGGYGAQADAPGLASAGSSGMPGGGCAPGAAGGCC